MPTRVDATIAGLSVSRRTGASGAPTVVFIHGAMDRGAAFVKVIRRLDDLTTVRYDRRGYGRSIDAGICSSIDEQVDDALAVSGTEGVVLVGHSLGGVVALAAATRCPDQITGLFVYEPPMPWEPWWPAPSVARADSARSPEDEAEAFMRRVVGDAVWEGLPGGTRQQRRSEGPALVADLRTIRRSPVPYHAAEIAVPTIVAFGSETSKRHARAARVLAAELPYGRLLAVDGAAHGGHTSHPDAFADGIRLVLALG